MAVHRRRRVAAITAAGARAGGVRRGRRRRDGGRAVRGRPRRARRDQRVDRGRRARAQGTGAHTRRPRPARETTYLGATWTVDEVSYRSAGVDELGVETGPAAVVGYTVANTGEGVLDLPMTAERLSLLDGDDFAIPADTTAGNGEVLVVGGRSSFEAIFPLGTQASRPTTWPTTFRVGVEGKVPALVPLAGEMPPVDYPLPLDIPVTVDGELIGGSGTLRLHRGRGPPRPRRGATRTPASSLSPARSTSPRAGPAGPRTSTGRPGRLGRRHQGRTARRRDPAPDRRPPGRLRLGHLGVRHPGGRQSRHPALRQRLGGRRQGRRSPSPSCPDAAPGCSAARGRAVDPGRAPGRERPIVGQVPPRAHGGEPGGGRDAAQVVRVRRRMVVREAGRGVRGDGFVVMKVPTHGTPAAVHPMSLAATSPSSSTLAGSWPLAGRRT